jgi:ATP-dependent Clp protease ATP-binding subunit ClpA
MTTQPRVSSSLVLIWQVAEFEARRLTSPTIEPLHFLLGLSKVVDLDLPAMIKQELPNRGEILEECLREVRRLRHLFQNAGLDATAFRRRLRRALGDHGLMLECPGCLHRGPAARKVFADAENYAQLDNGVVYPAHLLFAILATNDTQRDRVLKELGINEERLQEAAAQEFLRLRGIATTCKSQEAVWN